MLLVIACYNEFKHVTCSNVLQDVQTCYNEFKNVAMKSQDIHPLISQHLMHRWIFGEFWRYFFQQSDSASESNISLVESEVVQQLQEKGEISQRIAQLAALRLDGKEVI